MVVWKRAFNYKRHFQIWYPSPFGSGDKPRLSPKKEPFPLQTRSLTLTPPPKGLL